jgi:hypothetical protein
MEDNGHGVFRRGIESDAFAAPIPRPRNLVDQWICWWVGGPEAAIDALA